MIYAPRRGSWTQSGLRTWDHFRVVVENQEEESENEEGSERLGGLDPRSEVEKSKFQELVLCSSGGRTEIREDEHDGLTAPKDRLVKAANAIKATTTALRNKNKFTVLDEIRGDGGRGGNMQTLGEKEAAAERYP